ncbi:hypothetical protein [Pseudovibrio sp. SCP19]|uniref:hypothetical protein n=1 Tax=Pseudovibrio sp. SCP19 TaxID=3141374 RepID=UPI003336862C
MARVDWAPEAALAIDLCKSWTNDLKKDLNCDVYLFGSVIYESGDQFDPQNSDLDLIFLFTNSTNATERVKQLIDLRTYKATLELEMVPKLHRTNCEEAGVSIVPIYQLDLQANIHKSGARRFFDRNIFLDLNTEQESIGLLGAGSCSFPDESRQALEYVQKIRNQFLSISANSTGGIPDFDGSDPLPKSLARVAAQLVPDADVGTWYDTRFGLEYIWDELSRRRSESDLFAQLYRKISVRRGGRGKNRPLSDQDQLLLAEILYDRATAFPTTPIATWEIRFIGIQPSEEDKERVLTALRSLVPDGEIIGVFKGSIIVRLRSSLRSYETVKKLHTLGVLSDFFEVEEAEISDAESENPFSIFSPQRLIDRLADHIARWHPETKSSGFEREASLIGRLEDWLHQDRNLADLRIRRDKWFVARDSRIRPDFLIDSVEPNHEQPLAIELVHLYRRHIFFSLIDRVRAYSMPTILVVIGTSKLLEELRKDIQRVAFVDSMIRVVTIEIKTL